MECLNSVVHLQFIQHLNHIYKYLGSMRICDLYLDIHECLLDQSLRKTPSKVNLANAIHIPSGFY